MKEFLGAEQLGGVFVDGFFAQRLLFGDLFALELGLHVDQHFRVFDQITVAQTGCEITASTGETGQAKAARQLGDGEGHYGRDAGGDQYRAHRRVSFCHISRLLVASRKQLNAMAADS